MTATSSSDRIHAAREALNATQRGNSARGIAEANRHIADLSAALRSLIEPPAIEEGVSEIVERVLRENRGVRPTVTRAVEAGILAGWNSWEPETANVPEEITVTASQYDGICDAIDRAKNDDRSLDTDEYAGMVLSAIGGRIA